MNSRSASLFLILLLPLLAASASARKAGLPGGWQNIKNVKDQHVQAVGKFAVDEYNKQSKGPALVFIGVVGGKKQVVAGLNYLLDIEANNGESTGKYQAMVWEKPWENLMKLTSFKSMPVSPVKP